MPKISFGPNTASDLLAVVDAFQILLFGAELNVRRADLIVGTYGVIDLRVEGEGFETTTVQGVRAPVGGRIDLIEFSHRGETLLKIEDLGVTATRLVDAVVDERLGRDSSAVERLLTGLDWRYVGNDADDVLSEFTFTLDNVRIELRGNDTFLLGGGDDDIFLGSGRDLAVGGSGSDRLLGGDGEDTLFGGSGADLLDGGRDDDVLVGNAGADWLAGGGGDDVLKGLAGRDRLLGGNDDDRLFGHGGNDVLDGGNGDDTMRGGAGQDVFILGRGGHDVVVDFEAGVDVLRLKGDPTLSVEAVDDSVTVRWNHGSATFLGLTVDEFEAGLG